MKLLGLTVFKSVLSITTDRKPLLVCSVGPLSLLILALELHTVFFWLTERVVMNKTLFS